MKSKPVWFRHPIAPGGYFTAEVVGFEGNRVRVRITTGGQHFGNVTLLNAKDVLRERPESAEVAG